MSKFSSEITDGPILASQGMGARRESSGARARAASGSPALPQLCAVWPSGSTVSPNLRQVSLVFEEAVAAQVTHRLALSLDDGTLVHLPFQPRETWSPDRRRLTLGLVPGRLRTTLRSGATGGGITLLLDGRPVHYWRILHRELGPPSPDTWVLGEVRAGTRAPLVVDLGVPIDALGRNHITVCDGAGRRVCGMAQLFAGEELWTFKPAEDWSSGPFHLVVHPELASPSGERVVRPVAGHGRALAGTSPDCTVLDLRIEGARPTLRRVGT